MSWGKSRQRWVAQLYLGKQHTLGRFLDEQDAARAYDKRARQLRPNGQAHGGRSGATNGAHASNSDCSFVWLRLNFPTPEEEAYAAQQAMPVALSAEEQALLAVKVAAVVA